MIKYKGIADSIEKRRIAAVEAGRICKNCGGAIEISKSGNFHVVSFMTLCDGSRGTWAELVEKGE